MFSTASKVGLFVLFASWKRLRCTQVLEVETKEELKKKNCKRNKTDRLPYTSSSGHSLCLVKIFFVLKVWFVALGAVCVHIAVLCRK